MFWYNNLTLSFPVLYFTDLVGGSLFGLLSKNNRFGRNPVVLLGILVHFVAFYLIFLNMPGDAPVAPVGGTDSSAYIKSRYSDGHVSLVEGMAGSYWWLGIENGAVNPFMRVCYPYKIICQVLKEPEWV